MPLILATRAPTQGTALLQVSPQRYLLIWTRTVWCPSWLWYAATCPDSLAEVSWLSRPTACRSVRVCPFLLIFFSISVRPCIAICASFFSPVSYCTICIAAVWFATSAPSVVQRLLILKMFWSGLHNSRLPALSCRLCAPLAFIWFSARGISANELPDETTLTVGAKRLCYSVSWPLSWPQDLVRTPRFLAV